MRSIKFLLVITFTMIFLFSCGEDYTPEEEAYIKKIEQERSEKDEYMKNDPNSPFNYKGKVEFHPLNYYDVDPEFVFESPLIEFHPKDTVNIFGTKGEKRKVVRHGFVEFTFEDSTYRLNVYKGTVRDSIEYYSIWFTDQTTNDETYGVGRYLNFELNKNPNHIYTIDFNNAYNPYCAYSKEYSCAIPRKEDHIDLEITAGEKIFHD